MAIWANARVIQRRKGRERFRCEGRWGYPSRENAESDAARLTGRTGVSGLEVKHCWRCRGWHVKYVRQGYRGH